MHIILYLSLSLSLPLQYHICICMYTYMKPNYKVCNVDQHYLRASKLATLSYHYIQCKS